MVTGMLGKQPAKNDPRDLKLASYLPELPKFPKRIDYASAVPTWGMMMNDTLGDCTCAAAGHMVGSWTFASAGTEVIVPDEAVLAAYEVVGGYDPFDSTSDRGAVCADVLKYWRKTGVGGHKIDAYVSVKPKDTNSVKEAIYLFGGVYVGLQLPLSAQKESIWSGHTEPGSWGGHCVPILAYDPKYLTCVTWGSLKKMTWGFFRACCDEAFAVLSSSDWVYHGKCPPGFSLAQLQADLRVVTGG